MPPSLLLRKPCRSHAATLVVPWLSHCLALWKEAGPQSSVSGWFVSVPIVKCFTVCMWLLCLFHLSFPHGKENIITNHSVTSVSIALIAF